MKRPVTIGTRPNAGGAIVKSRSQLAKTPADKGSAIVRQKQSAPSKDAVGKRAPAQKGYMTSPDGIRKPKYKPDVKSDNKNDLAAQQRNRILGNNKKDDLKVKRGLRNIRKKVGNVAGAVGNQARSTMQDKGEKMQDAKVTSAKRGVYNLSLIHI